MLRIFFIVVCLVFYIANPAVAQQQCAASRVKLQMLGTGGPELIDDDRASTSYLIWLDNKARILIDTGPGSVQNFKRSGAKFQDIDIILYSHFHVDHSADLPTYIKGAFFTDRSKDLQIYGPSGDTYIASAEQFTQRLFNAKTGVYPYLSPFITQDAQSSFKIARHNIEWSYKNRDVQPIINNKEYAVKAVAVHHGPFPAFAYRIEAYGCVLSFTGDMSGRLHTITDLIKDSDLLVAHNAIPEDATGVPQLLHMKPSYIGTIAAAAKVKKLLLTHMMERSINRQDETVRLIRKHYSGPIVFPSDLQSIQVSSESGL